MIKEDYVSFEVAKLLKEKGFDAECNYEYGVPVVERGYVLQMFFKPIKNSELVDEAYAAPTLQMAMKWLREVHNLFIFISTWLRHKDGTVQYYYEIRNLNDKDFETIAESTITEFDSLEKTCEAAIKYCLENLI